MESVIFRVKAGTGPAAPVKNEHMKNIFIILLLVAGSEQMRAQPARLNESKFRINLPDFWRPGNKIWKTLPEKLPAICEELKDKDLCGDDCNPRYTVEFYMSPPYAEDYATNLISPNPAGNPPTETWEFVTYYRFQCYLLLYDNKTEKLVTKIIVVDSSEIWTIRNRATIQTYAPPPPSAYQLRVLPINTQGPGLAPSSGTPQFTPQRGQTPYNYIKNNAAKLAPQEKDLLYVVDSKFREL